MTGGINKQPSVGSIYLSPEITKFLFDLVSLPKEGNTLSIGMNKDDVKHIEISTQIDFISANPNLVDFEKIKEHYDRIVCAPMFGFSVKTESSQTSEEFWLRWSLDHLSKKGFFIIILPIGLLSNYSQEPVRKTLVDRGTISANIELPSGWAEGTNIQANILLVGKVSSKRKETTFLRLNDTDSINWEDISQSILKQSPKFHKSTTYKIFTIPAKELGSSRLDLNYYDPELSDISPPDDTYKIIKLSELVEIRSGNRFSNDDYKPNGIPLIQVKNINFDGSLDLAGTKEINTEIAITDRSYLEPGDIIITIAGSVGKVAYIPQGKLCIDTSLRRLRVLDHEIILPEYLALFLSSDSGQKQIKRLISGSVINVLSSPNLQEINIFVPPIQKQKQVIKEHNVIKAELIRKLLSVFPLQEKMQALITPKPATSSEQSTQEKALEEIIQTEMPFPIAYPFSVFMNSIGENPQTRLEKLVDISEAIVYYLFGILLADQLYRLRLQDPKLYKIINQAVYGYSIDKRLECIRFILKGTKGDSGLLFVPEIIEAKHEISSQIHNELRNKISHILTQPEAWCNQEIEKYYPRVIQLLESILQLKDYKLAVLSKITRKEKQYQHHMINFLGNNPTFPKEIEDLETLIDIDTDRVFLLDSDNNTLDLHPMYMMHAWQSTGMLPHLCYLKQVTGENEIKIESIHGAGEEKINIDLQIIYKMINVD
ncbi:MAG: restriction endonuclease subunit S [Anaerolineales bacterium]|jgi:hypothetical protein